MIPSADLHRPISLTRAREGDATDGRPRVASGMGSSTAVAVNG